MAQLWGSLHNCYFSHSQFFNEALSNVLSQSLITWSSLSTKPPNCCQQSAIATLCLIYPYWNPRYTLGLNDPTAVISLASTPIKKACTEIWAGFFYCSLWSGLDLLHLAVFVALNYIAHFNIRKVFNADTAIKACFYFARIVFKAFQRSHLARVNHNAFAY